MVDGELHPPSTKMAVCVCGGSQHVVRSDFPYWKAVEQLYRHFAIPPGLGFYGSLSCVAALRQASAWLHMKLAAAYVVRLKGLSSPGGAADGEKLAQAVDDT